MLPEDVVEGIFSNIEPIRDYHQQLVGKMRDAMLPTRLDSSDANDVSAKVQSPYSKNSAK